MYPSVYIFIGCVLGFVSAYYINSKIILAIFISIILIIGVALKFFKLISQRGLVLFSVFLIIGSFLGLKNERLFNNDFIEQRNSVTNFQGTIVSEPVIKEFGVYYIFKPYNQDRCIRLYDKNNCDVLIYGDVINVSFRLEQPKGKRNPGSFDYKLYLKTINVSATGNIISYDKIGFKPESKIRYFSIRIKEYILDLISKYIPSDKAGLIEGMLLGVDDNISKDTEESFRASGLSHLLTVSGGQAVLVLVPVSFIFKLFKVNKRLAYIIEIIFLVIFAFITGLGVSITRAVIMMSITRIALLFGKNHDAKNSLVMSAILLFFHNPYNIFSAGFLLSFSATFFLMVLPTHLTKFILQIPILKELPKSLIEVISVSLAAQIGVLPLTSYFFNKVSILGLFANIIVTPLISVLYIIAFIAIVFNTISIGIFGAIGGIFTYSLYSIGYAIEYVSVVFSNFILSEFTTSFAIFNVIAYYFGILLVMVGKFRSISTRHKVLFVVAFFILVNVPVNSLYSGIEITYIDVGQGDSILVRLPNKKNVLIDTGFNEVETINVLRYKNIKEIDVLFLTHSHDDHIGGAAKLISDIEVKELVIPQLVDYSKFDDIINLAKNNGVKITVAKYGDRFEFSDNVDINVLSPIPDKSKKYSVNNTSLVLRINYNSFNALFTGDIEEKAEKDVLEKLQTENSIFLLECNVLKVPHHGSSTSLERAFLKNTSPEASVISVGIDNRFNHPSVETIDKLEECTKIYRTDLNGAIIVKSDGKKFARIKSYLKG